MAPVADSDPNVLTSLVDAIEPPVLMLSWNEPWLEPEGPCFLTGHLVVTAVAARLEVSVAQTRLEELVEYVRGRLRADASDDWTLDSVSGPRVFLIAKTNYLAAQIALRVVIDNG